MKLKKIWKKTWDFLWHSDSLLSWIVDLILLYILIKFIFFPSLGLAFGTKLPLAIVESTSMEHNMNFESWWNAHSSLYEERGINKEKFLKFDFKNGFNKGDILILFGYHKKNISIGDVILFDAEQPRPITHRVVVLHNNELETLGDNNFGQLSFERDIKKEQVIGKVIAKIPKLGWAKIIFVDIFKSLSR